MKSFLFNRRTAYALLGLTLLAAWGHATLLRALALPLSAGDERVNTTHLLFLRSARITEPAFQFTAKFALEDPQRRVLVFRDHIRRAEAMGASRPFLETTIAQLVDYGVPKEQIEVIGDPDIMTRGEMLAFMANWLSQQDPATEVLVVTHLFRTSYIAAVADARVDSKLRARMHVTGFPRRGITESNWWKSGTGLKSFFSDFLRRIHLVVFGERRPNITWDPDEYEQALREMNK